MAAVQQERVQQDWEREAIDLKRQGLVSNDIAEAVGKSASTVRKVIARAREAGDLPAEFAVVEPPEEQTTVDDFTTPVQLCKHPDCGEDAVIELTTYTGNGRFCEPHATEVSDRMAERTSWPEWFQVLQGQRDVPPEDDPEFEARDPLEDFRAEAGEAVGPMPEREMDGGVTVEHRLAGTRQMALDLGPNAAPVTGATIQFKSLKHESGHFGMGDIVTGTFTARIVGIPAKEAFDKDSEEYRAKPIAYVAEITEFEYEAAD